MKLLFMAALAVVSFAQIPGAPSMVPAEDNPNLPRYWVIYTGTAVTLQATTTSDPAYLETGNVYCVAAQSVTISSNGAAATTTAGTLKQFGFANSQFPPSLFTASNAGAGTAGMVFQVAAGQTLPLRLAPLALLGRGGTGQNITLTSTGTCTFQYLFRTVFQ